MLQFRAFILSLCTLFYLVEYAAVPQMMTGDFCGASIASASNASGAAVLNAADNRNCSQHSAPCCCHKTTPGQAHQSTSGCAQQPTRGQAQQSTSGCAQRSTPGQAHQNTDRGKKAQCPKPLKGCNPSGDCCLNCPLCYVTVLPVTSTKLQEQRITTEYNLWSASYVYLYHTSCWKPPNQA